MYNLNHELIPWSTIWQALTPSAQTVFLAIVSRCQSINLPGCWLTYAEASERLGLDRSTFCRAIRMLRDLEFIEVTSGKFPRKRSAYFPVQTWERWGLLGFKPSLRTVGIRKKKRDQAGRFFAGTGATLPQSPKTIDKVSKVFGMSCIK